MHRDHEINIFRVRTIILFWDTARRLLSSWGELVFLKNMSKEWWSQIVLLFRCLSAIVYCSTILSFLHFDVIYGYPCFVSFYIRAQQYHRDIWLGLDYLLFVDFVSNGRYGEAFRAWCSYQILYYKRLVKFRGNYTALLVIVQVTSLHSTFTTFHKLAHLSKIQQCYVSANSDTFLSIWALFNYVLPATITFFSIVKNPLIVSLALIYIFLDVKRPLHSILYLHGIVDIDTIPQIPFQFPLLLLFNILPVFYSEIRWWQWYVQLLFWRSCHLQDYLHTLVRGWLSLFSTLPTLRINVSIQANSLCKCVRFYLRFRIADSPCMVWKTHWRVYNAFFYAGRVQISTDALCLFIEEVPYFACWQRFCGMTKFCLMNHPGTLFPPGCLIVAIDQSSLLTGFY